MTSMDRARSKMLGAAQVPKYIRNKKTHAEAEGGVQTDTPAELQNQPGDVGQTDLSDVEHME